MRRTRTPSTSESTLASTRGKQVRIAHACKFLPFGAHSAADNLHWLALEVPVPHHLLETSPPDPPHLALKSESSVPVAEVDKVFSAAELPELAELAAQSEDDEDYDLSSTLALMQAET
jgi:hypothetical protein